MSNLPPPGPGPSTARIVRNVVGALLVLAGVTGVIVPILQHLLLIAAGLVLLEFPGKARLHAWLRQWRPYDRAARWCEERARS